MAIFDGQYYKFASWQPTKREAQDIKVYYRSRGWKVRVVRDGIGYSIYMRLKGITKRMKR